MHFTSALATIAAIGPLAHAHGGANLPRIVGLNPKDLKTRDLLSTLAARFADVHEYVKAPEEHLQTRQEGAGCGAGAGSCAAGYCCSPEGICSQDPDACISPGCQYAYGPACPENITPAGLSTASIPRTRLGSVPYGGNGVYSCTKPGTIAITFDDGPQKVYTSHILDLLDRYNAKATFFVTGNNINKGQIDITPEYINVIKRMDSSGHQIASHTWTHLDLSVISAVDRKNQMIKNEMALRNIIGKIPTYMRPPYSSCTGVCETDMAALGYHVIYFDVDTDDYDQDAPNLIQKSKDWFKGNITAGGATAAKGAKWLEISHDIHEQTANNLTEYMLSTLTTLGYKAVTVGECLDDPVANWYRPASGAGTPSSTAAQPSKTSSAPVASSTKKVSTDASCGGTNQFTCAQSAFGNCCSVNGWCGSTAAYCGTGCQTAFGICGSNPVGSSSAVKTSSVVKTSSTAVVNTSKASSAAPQPTNKVSTDGTCGGTTGLTCTGSGLGNCCSQYGWCGSTTGHCGTGCQKGFGTCT